MQVAASVELLKDRLLLKLVSLLALSIYSMHDLEVLNDMMLDSVERRRGGGAVEGNCALEREHRAHLPDARGTHTESQQVWAIVSSSGIWNSA